MNVHGLINILAPREQMAARIASLSAPKGECYYFGAVSGSNFPRLYKQCRVYDGWVQMEYAALSDDRALIWAGGLFAELRDPPAFSPGLTTLEHRGGWSAIMPWMGGDHRIAFIARGDLTFAELVRLARQRWPEVWARFKFPVVEVDREGRLVGGGA